MSAKQIHHGQNARERLLRGSVASLLLSTEALIAEKPEKKAGGAGAMPDMGGTSDMGI